MRYIVIASKTIRGRVWLLVDYGTHYCIKTATRNSDDTYSVLAVGQRAYVERRWRSL